MTKVLKSEIRISKYEITAVAGSHSGETSMKYEIKIFQTVFDFGLETFKFVSDFEFRASKFIVIAI